ncbi:YggS family pyridoxal phosphate-dependent enzyme [Babesia caballi]|uniref:YggS family pyridoxal phosphate-dependent enzyme n=1 Tax=Babesia caballi TaxID=5871 RepID=A0AAV4LY89_BABCB|nr:YggS family pyridoxal phosphate-dependent enzyme [Babesia caballi]
MKPEKVPVQATHADHERVRQTALDVILAERGGYRVRFKLPGEPLGVEGVVFHGQLVIRLLVLKKHQIRRIYDVLGQLDPARRERGSYRSGQKDENKVVFAPGLRNLGLVLTVKSLYFLLEGRPLVPVLEGGLRVKIKGAVEHPAVLPGRRGDRLHAFGARQGDLHYFLGGDGQEHAEETRDVGRGFIGFTLHSRDLGRVAVRYGHRINGLRQVLGDVSLRLGPPEGGDALSPGACNQGAPALGETRRTHVSGSRRLGGGTAERIVPLEAADLDAFDALELRPGVLGIRETKEALKTLVETNVLDQLYDVGLLSQRVPAAGRDVHAEVVQRQPVQH